MLCPTTAEHGLTSSSPPNHSSLYIVSLSATLSLPMLIASFTLCFCIHVLVSADPIARYRNRSSSLGGFSWVYIASIVCNFNPIHDRLAIHHYIEHRTVSHSLRYWKGKTRVPLYACTFEYRCAHVRSSTDNRSVEITIRSTLYRKASKARTRKVCGSALCATCR